MSYTFYQTGLPDLPQLTEWYSIL